MGHTVTPEENPGWLVIVPDIPPNNTHTESVCNGLFTLSEWNGLIAHLSLPDRQLEILHLLLNGKGDKQIAEKLEISLPTIRTHLQRIYVRFGVSNRTTLVIEVFRRFRQLETPVQEQMLHEAAEQGSK